MDLQLLFLDWDSTSVLWMVSHYFPLKGNEHTRTLKETAQTTKMLFLLRQISMFPVREHFQNQSSQQVKLWINAITFSSHLNVVSKTQKHKSDLTEQLLDLLTLSILCAYNVIKTPTDCCSSSRGQTLRKWPAGLNLSLTFHSCEEWMLLKVKLAPVLFWFSLSR